MTNREFLNAVISANISEEVTAYATTAIKKADAKNDKRRTTPTKAQVANAALVDALVAGLSAGEVLTSAKVAADMGISTQKATALLRSAVASKALVEIAPIKGKSGKVKAYALPSDEDGEDTED